MGKLALAITFLAISALALISRADIPDHKNAFSANASVTVGGLALGLDFENGYTHTYGIGGYFRLIPDSTKSIGLTTVGAFIRPHFSRQQWDLYLSPGFGINFFSPTSASGISNQVYLGPSLGLGLLYEFNPQWSVGGEYTVFSNWIGGVNDYRGIAFNDLSVKVRFIY